MQKLCCLTELHVVLCEQSLCVAKLCHLRLKSCTDMMLTRSVALLRDLPNCWTPSITLIDTWFKMCSPALSVWGGRSSSDWGRICLPSWRFFSSHWKKHTELRFLKWILGTLWCLPQRSSIILYFAELNSKPQGRGNLMVATATNWLLLFSKIYGNTSV